MFYHGGGVFRALSRDAVADWQALSSAAFFRQATDDGRIVRTWEVDEPGLDQELRSGLAGDWAQLLQHETLSFITYPYEWSFDMLKDAALLHLELLQSGLEEGLISKDGSAYNIQWQGTRPVFIDTASFTRARPGEPWAGYRQFCQLFLFPLMLTAYRNVDFRGWLRGQLEGITPQQINQLLTGWTRLRKGVIPHVMLQARLQSSTADTNRSVKTEIRDAGFSTALIQANLKRLTRLVGQLNWAPVGSEWSGYTDLGHYLAQDMNSKESFVREVASAKTWELIWDLGANTGQFSRIVAPYANTVLALEGDALAVNRLYQALRSENNRTILPMVANLADPSPALGWQGRERKSLEQRGSPDLILCLALVHHVVIGANVPLVEFVEWLATFRCMLVIEFVDRNDAMVKTLLRNREDIFDDYHQADFETALATHFSIERRVALESGTRTIYAASPR